MIDGLSQNVTDFLAPFAQNVISFAFVAFDWHRLKHHDQLTSDTTTKITLCVNLH